MTCKPPGMQPFKFSHFVLLKINLLTFIVKGSCTMEMCIMF